jgi:hypothetical protein
MFDYIWEMVEDEEIKIDKMLHKLCEYFEDEEQFNNEIMVEDLGVMKQYYLTSNLDGCRYRLDVVYDYDRREVIRTVARFYNLG